MSKTKAQLEAELMDAKSDAIAWHQYAKRLEDKLSAGTNASRWAGQFNAGRIDELDKQVSAPPYLLAPDVTNLSSGLERAMAFGYARIAARSRADDEVARMRQAYLDSRYSDVQIADETEAYHEAINHRNIWQASIIALVVGIIIGWVAG